MVDQPKPKVTSLVSVAMEETNHTLRGYLESVSNKVNEAADRIRRAGWHGPLKLECQHHDDFVVLTVKPDLENWKMEPGKFVFAVDCDEKEGPAMRRTHIVSENWPDAMEQAEAYRKSLGTDWDLVGVKRLGIVTPKQ